MRSTLGRERVEVAKDRVGCQRDLIQRFVVLLPADGGLSTLDFPPHPPLHTQFHFPPSPPSFSAARHSDLASTTAQDDYSPHHSQCSILCSCPRRRSSISRARG